MLDRFLEYLLTSIMFFGIPILGIIFLILPFLFVKFILKKKLNWWIIILCLIASYIIFQIEIWVWWKFWEYVLEKMGEAFLNTF